MSTPQGAMSAYTNSHPDSTTGNCETSGLQPGLDAHQIAANNNPVRALAHTPAGPDHQVVTVVGPSKSFRRTPCNGCPWVCDNAGNFPPEAFVHSARTAYDMAESQFACHESGTHKPTTCAGYLLRGAEHNLAHRLALLRGQEFTGLNEGPRALFDTYRDMAIANGVEPDHPALQPCR